MRILLVEDDPTTSRSIELMLTHANLNVYSTDLGEEGVDLAKLYDYDLILLDLGLPDMNGHDVLRQLRMARIDTPILILTGSDDTDDKLKGFGFGADDYMTKPFSARELVARVQVLLRRPRADRVVEEPARTIGLLRIEPDGRRVFVDAVEVEVTRTEFDLLNVLSARPRVAFTRRQVVDAVWGEDWVGDEHLVDVHVLHVRRKLARESPAVFVETVRGVGYRMGPCR